MEATATASTGTGTTGPTTFSDPSLSWSDASSASTPSTDTPPAASASAATTEPPAATSAPEGQPQQPTGEPPKERWSDILDNARKKASEEALTKWREQYGWAEQINQQQFQEAMQWYAKYQGNPIDFLNALSNELTTHPEWGPQLRSLAAKTLAARTQQQPDAMPQPDVEITDGQGNVVGRTYSDRALAARDEWLTKRLMAQMEEKFSPVVKTVEQVQAERAEAERKAQATTFAQTYGGELAALPHFTELKADIYARLKDARLESDHPAELKAVTYQIYIQTLAEKVLPTLSQKAQSQLLDNLQQKAAASTSVNPGSAAPSTPKRYSNFNELPADMWK